MKEPLRTCKEKKKSAGALAIRRIDFVINILSIEHSTVQLGVLFPKYTIGILSPIYLLYF